MAEHIDHHTQQQMHAAIVDAVKHAGLVFSITDDTVLEQKPQMLRDTALSVAIHQTGQFYDGLFAFEELA